MGITIYSVHIHDNAEPKQILKTSKEETQSSPLSTSKHSEIRATCDTNLVHVLPFLPHATTAFSDGNQLVRDPQGEFAITALIRSINDPSDCGPATLSLEQWNWDLQSSTTASNTFLLSDLDQRCDRVYNQREIEDWVQRQLGSRRTGKKTTFGVD